MKFVRADEQRGVTPVRVLLALLACALIPLLAYAAAPAWWSQRSVTIDGATPDDYAPVNQGQLKNIATAAVAEMDAKLPSGAGDTLHSLVTSWSAATSNTNDFAPVNAGQLKSVAKPFYDRLFAVKYVDRYPWIASGAVPDDFAAVNIGEVKNLFDFDLGSTDIAHDADQNGLPDWWEKYYFGRTGMDPNAVAPRGDGATNLQAFQQGLDPIDNGEILAITPARLDETVPTGQTVTQTIRITNRTTAVRQLGFTPHSTAVALRYAYTDSDQANGPEFVWNDISATGVHLASVSETDDGFEAVALGFSFPFFGEDYSTVFVSSNGFATFGTGASNYRNYPLPNVSAPAALIAPFYNDLDLSASGDVYYQEETDRVIIQFENVARYDGDGFATFQIVLQADGTILFYYKEMVGTLDQATVGVQNAARDDGLTIAYNQPYLRANLAVRIAGTGQWEAAPWLQVQPAAASLLPGATADVAVTLDGGGTLTPGEFSGGITVTADDPSIGPREIPVTMALVDESQLDNDNDGLTNEQERALGTDPNKIDTDGDGMSDGWEVAHHLNPLSNDAAIDPDGDGSSNVEEYRRRTDPFDFFNGATPFIEIVSGNNQFGDQGTFAAQPLTVRVRKSDGQPYEKALVIFTVPSGSGQLASAASPGALQGTQMSVRTNADGLASAAFLLSDISGNSSRITAGTGASDRFVTTVFRIVSIYHPPPSPTPSPGTSPSPTVSPTPRPTPPYRYAIVDLGKDTSPTRVNNKGWVLMTGDYSAQGHWYRWKAGVPQLLTNPDPAQYYTALDMNDEGTVVGWGGDRYGNPYAQSWNESGVNDLQRGLIWPADVSVPSKVLGPVTASWVPEQRGSIGQAYLSAIGNRNPVTNATDMYGGAYTGDGAYGDRLYAFLYYYDILNAQRWSSASAAPEPLSFSHSTASWEGFFWSFDWQGALDSVSRANSSGRYLGQSFIPGQRVGVLNTYLTSGMVDGQTVDFDPVDLNEGGIVVGARGSTMVIRTPGAADQTISGRNAFYPVAVNDHVKSPVPQGSATPNPSATPAPAPQILAWDGNVPVLWERQEDGQTWYPFGLEEMIPAMDGWWLGNITDMNDSGMIVGTAWYKDPANPQAQWEQHGFLLLPVELVDTKNKVLDDGDDVNIEPKATVDEKKEKSIAWIEPHGAENTPDAPDMPQLALRFRGTETMELKIKWNLAVKFNRPRGNQPNEQKMKEEDEVYIPKKGAQDQPWKEEALDGVIEIFAHADWIATMQEKGFFGGEAELKYQLLKSDGTALGTEEKMLFSIGGKNPERAKCRKYIDDNATSGHGNMWFAYAIAKSESSAFNPGERYNQFWKKTGSYDKRPHKQGEPTWGKVSWEKSAGGFGLFQVTGDISSKFFTIPREQMWNWQKNVSAGLTILRHKQDAAYEGAWDYMNGTMPHRKVVGLPRGQRPQAKKANNGADVPVPDETVRGVTFEDGTARTIEAAVTIKAYNGATRHYVGWHNATKKWEFFRTNGKFNYVDRVCQEVE